MDREIERRQKDTQNSTRERQNRETERKTEERRNNGRCVRVFPNLANPPIEESCSYMYDSVFLYNIRLASTCVVTLFQI